MSEIEQQQESIYWVQYNAWVRVPIYFYVMHPGSSYSVEIGPSLIPTGSIIYSSTHAVMIARNRGWDPYAH